MIEVGRFVITGDWDTTPTPLDKLRIIMPPPGRVQGCGWEEFTQAVLEFLPKIIRFGCSFADIGAGTGIQTVAASLLGAHKLYACEINPDALIALESTLKANKVFASIINGSFPPEKVDVLLVTVGGTFHIEHAARLRELGSQIIVFDNDFQFQTNDGLGWRYVFRPALTPLV